MTIHPTLRAILRGTFRTVFFLLKFTLGVVFILLGAVLAADRRERAREVYPRITATLPLDYELHPLDYGAGLGD